MIRFLIITGMLFLSGRAFGQSQAKEVFMCNQAMLRIRAESQGAVRYEWYRDNVMVPGSPTAELVVHDAGTYKAVGVNAEGCVSDESVYIVVKHHRPTAVDDIATGKTNTAITIDVLKNDLSACAAVDPSSLTIVTPPNNGNAIASNGKITYTQERLTGERVSFSYSFKDVTGQLSTVGKVTLDLLSEALPVRLVNFDARKTERETILDWRTSGELNSDYFSIERSADMQAWTAIGRIQAAFQSSIAQQYQYVDSLPLSGLNYYRLKMVDADSTFTYSRVKSMHFPELSWAEVYPNPVDDQLFIVIRNPKVRSFRLISNSGIVRISRSVTDPSFTISMKQFPTGMYYIHFEQDNGAVKIFKLMHH